VNRKGVVCDALFSGTVELRLSGLTGTASHPDMQKIRIIGFFFENNLHWQFEAEIDIFTNGCFRLYMYLCTNKILIHNSLYVFDNWGKNLNHKKMWYNYSKKTFTGRAKSIRITSVRISGVLLHLYRGMRRIKTFRSTTDCIYDGDPIRLWYYNKIAYSIQHSNMLYRFVI
jgi:hypothetical protein